MAELTGREMVRRPGNAPGRCDDPGFTDRLASLANYRRMRMVAGRGMPGAPNLPAI